MNVSGLLPWVPDDLYELRKDLNSKLFVTKSADVIVTLWNTHGPSFSAVNVATALLSFPRRNSTPADETAVGEMICHYLSKPEEIRPRNAAGVVRSLALMRFKNQETVRAKREVFTFIQQQAVTNKDFFADMSSLSLCRLLQGFAVTGSFGDPFYQVAESHVQAALKDLAPDELVAIAVAYSKKNHTKTAILEQIEERVLLNPNKWSSSELAHLAFAFSSLNRGSERFYTTLYQSIRERSCSLTSDAIFFFLETYGKRKEAATGFMDIQAVLLEQAADSSARQLSLLLNSLTKNEGPDDRFFEQMELRVIELIPYSNPQDLHLFAIAFSRARAGSYSLFKHIRIATCKKLDLFSPLRLCLTYHAFSVRGIQQPDFYRTLEARLLDAQLEPYEVILFLWSMLLQKNPPLESLQQLLSRLNNVSVKAIVADNRSKLIECCSVLKTAFPRLYKLISGDILQIVEEAKQERRAFPTDRSPFQKRVEAALAHFGLHFEIEYYLDGQIVDIFIPSLKTVIEVNGKKHYYLTEPNLLTASSRMKQRILEGMGYRVVWISHFTWPDDRDKAAQQQFLKALL